MYFYCITIYIPDLAIKTNNNTLILPILIFAFFVYCAIRLLLKWEKLVNWVSLSVGKLLANPIEHLWHELERRLQKWSVHPKNFYKEVLQEEWKRIPSKTYINLIESMPHRIEACIKNNGWPTKY